MNLSLLDPFVLAQDYPELLAGTLRRGHSTCLRFSPKGDFLASGRVDGRILIFDLETYGVARKLRGHSGQIQSLRYFHPVSRLARLTLRGPSGGHCVELRFFSPG